jgi:hypothetical protein
MNAVKIADCKAAAPDDTVNMFKFSQNTHLFVSLSGVDFTPDSAFEQGI